MIEICVSTGNRPITILEDENPSPIVIEKKATRSHLRKALKNCKGRSGFVTEFNPLG